MALVSSKHPGILHLNGSANEKHEITLLPGVNKVSDEAWAEVVKSAAKHPALKHYFTESIIEELKGKKADEFDKLPAAEAVKLVKNTNVESLLKEFRSAEKRPEVLDAIEEQIKSLQPDAGGTEKPKE